MGKANCLCKSLLGREWAGADVLRCTLVLGQEEIHVMAANLSSHSVQFVTEIWKRRAECRSLAADHKGTLYGAIRCTARTHPNLDLQHCSAFAKAAKEFRHSPWDKLLVGRIVSGTSLKNYRIL